MKRNVKILFCCILLSICLGVVYGVSKQILKNNNENTEIKNVTNGIAMYVENDSGDYVLATETPDDEYIFNGSKSKCNNGVTAKWDAKTSSLITDDPTVGTSCFLYFDKSPCTGAACNKVLADKIIVERKDFTTPIDKIGYWDPSQYPTVQTKVGVHLLENTSGKMYSANDNDGLTIYFAGAPTDNYVEFAGFYWRIIRINSNGSIRMIYAGDASVIESSGNKSKILANGYKDTTNYYTAISKTSTVFNDCNERHCVGYMYTAGTENGNTTDSTVKVALDAWYKTNIEDKGFSSKVDINAGFCGDRSYIDGVDEENVPYHYYAARSKYGDYLKPSLNCANIATDLYTVSSSNVGNKALTYPVGLITADEIALAGSGYGQLPFQNDKNYLRTDYAYWTISPFQSKGDVHYGTTVQAGGFFTRTNITSKAYLRPVINLSGTVTLTGEGTIESPYVVG